MGRSISFLITPLAIQHVTQEASPPLLSQHPRPLDQRRIMADVLPVTAGEYRPPIPQLVPVEIDDGLFHALATSPAAWEGVAPRPGSAAKFNRRAISAPSACKPLAGRMKTS
jgi:hypothetical protein